MRPPVSAASSSVATAPPSPSATPVTGVTFTNGTHLKSKTQFNQIDVFVEHNRNETRINQFEKDPRTNTIGVVTSATSISSASSSPLSPSSSPSASSSSSNSSLLLCTPIVASTHTIGTVVVGHVKNALRADFDYRVDKNNANGNGCIGNSADTNYCAKFNETAVSNNKCLQNSSHASSARRHSDSQTIRTNVDSFQIVNKFAYNNQSDCHYLNGVDGDGASTTTTTAAVCPSEYLNSTNCASFLVNKKSGSGAGRKFELQSIDNCSDSEVSPLLDCDATNSIALIKNNSASLIFTRKELSPVVHRGKIAATTGATNNSSGCVSGGILTSEHVQQQRRSLQFNSGFNLSNNGNNINNNNNCNSSAAAAVAIQDRRKHAKSWYASIYTTLDEVAELDLKVGH